jgi:predicted AAA+ superfamily ATPase
VATTLLKRLHFLEDYYGAKTSMHFIRDKDGREVDFVTVVNNKIVDLIEVKLSNTDISSNLKYYSEKLQPENTVQLVYDLPRSFNQGHILVTTAQEYFANPPWEMV